MSGASEGRASATDVPAAADERPEPDGSVDDAATPVPPVRPGAAHSDAQLTEPTGALEQGDDVVAGGAEGAAGPMHRAGRYESRGGTLDRVRAYVLVTKPRIIELLLVTTVPAMVVAEQGWPSTWLVLATLLGGALSAGSANALNNHLDRDIDRLMQRTSARPTAMDEIAPRGALVLGLVLGVAGFVWLAVFVNLVAAALATFAIIFYVFVYTLGLKRRSSQGVVIGGIAGCMPVLTGWVAVSGGSLADVRPWLLFAIMLWWQPPHFWALAMKYRDDYAAAGLPMLPVTHGNVEATRQILLYSYLLLSLVLLYIAGAPAGWLFAAPALALTAGWLVFAHRLRREVTVAAAMRLFHYSTLYLALLFVAAAVDAAI
ncbi:MAG: protoheme IX farnesyltransferase [Nitriliruptoraceae bacterium]|nr:protoheme IX farnesyltransferase [Nitriliruptoraceae bacterium]